MVERKKDMIIAGGYNIYPVELDNVLFDHPNILEACTVGIPHEYRGETVKAFIVVKEGETLTEEEIREYCRDKLAHFKIPKYIRFVDKFPMTVTGKLQKFKMQEEMVKLLDDNS